MKFELKNEHLHASVSLKGAELNSIRFQQLEYLWQADKEVWPRHAPVLFPVVGRLKGDRYFYNQNEYLLTQHGFARDREFSFVYKTNTELELELKHDEETLKHYPFEFKLTVKYKLTENRLECMYRITNISASEALYFSVGAHPGFRVPLEQHEAFTDYVLHFHDGNSYKVSQLSGGLLSGQTKDLLLQNGELPLNTALFEQDALVFEGTQINTIELKSKKTRHGIRLECDGWPYFGIWSKPGCDRFVCLEPWYGIADSAAAGGEITAKKGIMSLMPGEFFNCRFSMEFF